METNPLFLWLVPTKLGFQASCLFLKPVGRPSWKPGLGFSPARSQCTWKEEKGGRAGGFEPLPSGPHVSPPLERSLLSLPRRRSWGRPVSLRSWPGERAEGPRERGRSGPLSGALVGLWTRPARKAEWLGGPVRGSRLRPAGGQRHLLAARAPRRGRRGGPGRRVPYGLDSGGRRHPRPRLGPALEASPVPRGK